MLAPASRAEKMPNGERGPASPSPRIKAFALLAERRHLLVRTEMRRTRRWRVTATAVCLAVPGAVFVLAVLLLIASGDARLAGDLAVGFAALWPAVMLFGAALRSAGAVAAERDAGTALQIILTPLPRRAIAASKVLPALPPFLWGIVAALPVYILADVLRPPMAAACWVPAGALGWPLRLLLGLAMGFVDPNPNLAAGLAGPVMALTDIGLVWIAAQVGAAMAVRDASALSVALRLLGRLLGAAGVMLLLALLVSAFLGIFGGGACTLFGGSDLAATLFHVAIAVIAFALFMYFWWQETLFGAATRVLGEFARFDLLAMDEPDPSPGRLGDGWDWLEAPERP